MVSKLPTPCYTQHIFFQVYSQTVSRGEGILQMQLRYQISRKRLLWGWPDLTRQVHKRDRAFPEKNKKQKRKIQMWEGFHVTEILCFCLWRWRDRMIRNGTFLWELKLTLADKKKGDKDLHPKTTRNWIRHNYISLEDSTRWMIMTDTLSLALVRLLELRTQSHHSQTLTNRNNE